MLGLAFQLPRDRLGSPGSRPLALGPGLPGGWDCFFLERLRLAAGLGHVDPSFVHSPLSGGGWGLLGTGFGAGARPGSPRSGRCRRCLPVYAPGGKGTTSWVRGLVAPRGYRRLDLGV
ncbi:hypothetical protein ILYODFUR_038767 [Ilyodon furcidens]|uniref:Uncharacterized protein n=1 Tax=Ilyodon furcidens TaxID=33524 RepID=A0ABV0T472_9TELE